MIIWTTNQKVWWTDNTPNYPSYNFFQQFKNRMEQNSSIKMEQKNLETLEVVVPVPEITYIWVTTRDYEFYYYYNRILKVLPNAYVIEFKLDIFTTFTLPYYNDLFISNTQVKLNRHHKLSKRSLMYKDELMDAIPFQYEENKVSMLLNNSYVVHTGGDANDLYRLYITSNLSNAFYSVGDGNQKIAPLIYYVFRTTSIVKPLVAIPALCKTVNGDTAYTNSAGQNVLEKKYTMVHLEGLGRPPSININYSTTPQEVFPSESGVANGANILNEIANSEEYSNRFLGVYVLPYILSDLSTRDIGYTQLNWKRNEVKTYANFLSIGLRTHGKQLGVSNSDYLLGELVPFTFLDFDNVETRPTLNQNNKMHFLTIHKMEFKLMNTEIPFNRLTFSEKFTAGKKVWEARLKNAYFNFTSEPFITGEILFGNRFDTIISYGQSLPLFTDDYNKYIGATKATRDTGLNIAKFNNTLAFTQSAAGLIQSVASGNTKGIVSAATGTVGAFGRFFTEPARINAQLRDARASKSVSLVGGDIMDTITGSYIFKYDWIGVGAFVQYKEPDSNTIKNLNNVLYWYGNYLPITGTLHSFTVNSDFNYYEFDAEYLQNIFSTTFLKYTRNPIQRDYMNMVFQQLVNGVRLYETTPDTLLSKLEEPGEA